MRKVEFSQRTVDLVVSMNDAVALCNEKRAAGLPYAEKDGALDKAKAAAKSVNNAILEDAMRELAAVGKTDKLAMFKDYMSDWAVQGYTVKETDTGIVAQPKAEIRILFSALDGACRFQVTSRGDWAKMASVLVDNCMLNWASKQNGGGVALLSLPADMLEFRGKLGENWLTKDGKPRTGMDYLVKQFNEVVAAIFPAEMAIKMTNADVRNFSGAIKGYKRTKVNSAMTFKVAGGKSMEEIMFDAIYTRMNNLSVIIEDDYKRDGGAVGTGKPAAATAQETTAPAPAPAEKPADAPAA